MTQYATSLIAVRTYPHIDYYEISLQAGELLQRCMLKDVDPITVIAKRPQLWGLDGGKTYANSPMMHLIQRGEQLEKQGDCLVVSICAGFTAADIYEIGPSVTVTVDLKHKQFINNATSDAHEDKKTMAKQYAQQIAEEFMDYAWETRHIKTEIYRTVDQMVTYINNYLSDMPIKDSTSESSSSLLCPSTSYQVTQKPIVIADVTDNPGSGHYGDATNILAGLIAANIPDVVFYAIFDPDAVLQGEKIGVGRTGSITLGGKYDPSCGGQPLTLTGKVISLTDGCFQTFGPMGFGGVWQNYGLSMMFRVENTSIDVIVITNNGQLLDLAQITSMGCDPLHRKVIAVKSKQHFRACLTPIAGDIITVDGGGLGSAILNGGEYKFARRPIWPLDQI
jgi:microcystin degradation protein MlrC